MADLTKAEGTTLAFWHSPEKSLSRMSALALQSLESTRTAQSPAATQTSPLAVTYGHGLTLEMPELDTTDAGSTFELTFGVSGTGAATVSTEQIKIQVATVNATFNDGSNHALPVGVHTVSGNQIQFTIGDPTDEGVTNINFADGDKIVLNVLAFAIPA